jgi:hypothetical protein
VAHPLVAVHTAWVPHSYRTSSMPAWHMLIMKIARRRTPPERCRTPLGHLPDALESGIHGVRTRWIPGFMAFQLARYTRTALLTVPESREPVTGARAADRAISKPPARWCLWVPRCPCALWCASRSPARSALRPCRPTCGPAVLSDPAVRRLRTCHPGVLVSCGRGFRRVLG